MLFKHGINFLMEYHRIPRWEVQLHQLLRVLWTPGFSIDPATGSCSLGTGGRSTFGKKITAATAILGTNNKRYAFILCRQEMTFIEYINILMNQGMVYLLSMVLLLN